MGTPNETVRSIVFSDIIELKGQLSGNIKPLECDLCGKKFGLIAELEIHLKMHYIELETDELNPMDCLKIQMSIPGEEEENENELECNEIHLDSLEEFNNGDQSIKKTLSTAKTKDARSILWKQGSVGLDLSVHRNNYEDNSDNNNRQKLDKSIQNGLNVEITRSSKQMTKIESLFSCLNCDSVFGTESELQKHSKKHREKPYACEICHKRFLCSFSLKYHLKTHSEDSKNYTCTACDQGFRTIRELNAHMKAHMEDKPFSCDTCEKRFTFESDLKRHLRTHTGEKNHICGTCNKRFSESSKLKRHLMSHTETKPFVCEVCNKLFSQNASLKRHLVTHTGEKNFTCQICDRSFADISTLRRHLKSHSEEKPFDCEHCEKKFKSARTLRNHVNSVHNGNNGFACEPCAVRFVDFYSFRDHLKVHPVSLTCSECNERFFSDESYRQHIRTHSNV